MMLIQPELSRTTVQTGAFSRTAAESSCIVWRKSPSPQTASTWSSGRASCAPIAAGSVKPMVLKPPEVMWVRGSRVSQRCLTILRQAGAGHDDGLRPRRGLHLANGAGHGHRDRIELTSSTCSCQAARSRWISSS